MSNITKPRLIQFDNLRFRSHATGYLMVEPQGGTPLDKYLKKKAELSETKIKYEEKILSAKEKRDSKTEGTKGWESENDRVDKLEFEFAQKAASLTQEISRLELEKDNVIVSKTTETYLLSVYIKEKYLREKKIDNKFIQKGLGVEEACIDLICDVTGNFYVKNDERKYNDYIEGECDIDDAENDETIDNKAAWNIHTFTSNKNEDVKSIYFWQGISYMALFGRKKHRVANVLVNTPDGIVEDEMRRALYDIGFDKKDTQLYEDICQRIKLENNFDDIPKEERVAFSETIQWDENEYLRLVERIKDCRKWLNDYAIKDFFNCYGKEALIAEIGQEKYNEICFRLGFEKRIQEQSQEVEIPLVYSDLDLGVIEKDENGKIILNDNSEKEFQNKINERVKDILIGTISDAQLNDFEEIQKVESENISKIVDESVNSQKVSEIKTEEFEIEQTQSEEEIEEEIEKLASLSEQVEGEQVLSVEEDLISKINDCKSEQDCIDLYMQIKQHFQDYPKVKELLTIKRKSFETPEEETPMPTPVPKPKPKSENTEKSENKEEKDAKKDELKKTMEDFKLKIIQCKTGNEVKELYRDNKDFVSENKSYIIHEKETLFSFMERIGMERDMNPLL